MNLKELRDETGKFSKGQAYYIDDAVQKPFRCANCAHFDPENGQCNIVSEEGKPGEGYISAEGACTLYNAGAARITALQWLWGRGDEDGLAPETIRATMYMFTYSVLDAEPPGDLVEQAVISPERARAIITLDEILSVRSTQVY